MISCLVLSACSNYVEGKAAIKTWSTTSPTPNAETISMVKMPSWKYISPFPKTRFLERQPYRGAGLTKAPLELGLWKGTVRETEFSERALTPTVSQQSTWTRGRTSQGDPKLLSWRHNGALSEALPRLQPREGSIRPDVPHNWKHSLSEDRIASTVVTQQFPLLGHTGMPCSLGSEWGENEGKEKETDNTNSHSQRLILHLSLTH